jgi:dihydroorotate dehydrogenase (fumarate)
LSLTLRWIGILRGRVPISLAATGGVHSGLDMLKAIAVGADVVQVASVVYRQGVEVLGRMQKECEAWLDEHEYPSIEQFKGTLSQAACGDPAAFARANYTRAISSFVTDMV